MQINKSSKMIIITLMTTKTHRKIVKMVIIIPMMTTIHENFL
ncbi:hypothetical protein [Bacillus sp. OK048]|nr:hypothetical protein [Bacillus sp. OK048]